MSRKVKNVVQKTKAVTAYFCNIFEEILLGEFLEMWYFCLWTYISVAQQSKFTMCIIGDYTNKSFTVGETPLIQYLRGDSKRSATNA